GATSSNPFGFTAAGDALYFFAGSELWRTNGTDAGTVLLASLQPGVGGLTNVNGTLYFAAGGFFGAGVELFKHDPATTATTLVRDINTTVVGASSSPANLTALGSTLYFTATDGLSGVELWRSDGSAATTVPVKDIVGGAGGSNPSNLIVFDGHLYFTANDGTNGVELWKSDGTGAGTVLVADLNPGAAGSSPASLTVMGNALFFSALTADGGRELYRLDAGPSTPVLLRDIAPGTESAGPSLLTPVGGTLFFVADPGTRIPELWRTDGTAEGTQRVSAEPRSPFGLTNVNGTLYFSAADAQGAIGIWRTDGTAAGTTRLVDAGLLDRDLRVAILDAEGDGAPTPQDATAPAGTLVIQDLLAQRGGEPIQVDVTAAVQAALAAGKTRLTFRLTLDSPNPGNPLQIHSSTDPTRDTGLAVVTREATGVVADLYDAQGTLLAAGQSLLDLRTLDAGTFFLKIYAPAPGQVATLAQGGPLAFTLAATPPIPGASHPASDQDVIHGGDGDDLLIGNPHLDRLHGERGTDAFVAEAFEVNDLEAGEFRGAVAAGEDTATSQRDLHPLDPVVDGYIHDERLQVAVARAVGIPVTTDRGGAPVVQEHIRASQMAGLRRLDLTGLGIADLRGLEFATNLEALALAGNGVTDLSPLMPATVTSGDAVGSPVGLARLAHLSLDLNPVTDLGPLAELVALKSLSLDARPDLDPLASPNLGGVLHILGNPTPGVFDEFGLVVAASEDYVVVTAHLDDTGATDAGAVYVFDAASGSLLRTITHPLPQVGSQFGASVAIDGDLLVVGAPFDDAPAADSGMAYVFNVRTGAFMALFNPFPGVGDRFGTSVALADGRVLVGAPFDDTAATDAGAAYLFDAFTGTLLLPAIMKSLPAASDNFGNAVALSHDHALVGAPFDKTAASNAGAAYLFDAQRGTPVRTFANPEPLANDQFGSAVALSGEQALISTPFHGTGVAYLFDARTGERRRTFLDPSPTGSDRFGTSLALSGTRVLIGENLDSTTALFAGGAHLFDGKTGGLLRSYPNPEPAVADIFGFSVALGAGRVVAGVPGDDVGAGGSGIAYVLEGSRLAALDALSGLTGLRFLSLSHQQIADVTRLAGLDALEQVFLDGNDIADIGPLLRQGVVDDGDAGYREEALSVSDTGWLGSLEPTPGAFGLDYRFHAGAAGSATALARWEFTGLVPGTYEVSATWSPHESRASDAPYTVVTQVTQPGGGLADGSTTVPVNQKFAPDGAVAGGRPWQSLGVYATAGTNLRVELRNVADGLVAADAIRIVAVDPLTRLPLTVKPELARLDLRGNPLDDASHDLFVPQLTARDAADSEFVFLFDPNARPQWVTTVESQSVPQGGSLTLFLEATDPDAGDSIRFTAESDTPAVSTAVAGNRVTLTPAANFSGTARITLGAHDGPGGPGDWRGRSVEQTLLLSVGLGTVTGTVWQDLDGDGVRDAGEAGREGVEVFLDLDGNGALDRPATPTATTPWFAVDHLAGGSHVGDASSGQIAFDASGRLYVSDNQTHHVHRWDPALGQFVQFTASGGSQEARGPRAIAFGIDGDLYVASSFDRNVRRYNGTTGAFVEELWSDGDGILVSDRGIMAASPDRRILYIADFNPAAGAPVQIVRYDTETHALLSNFTLARVAGVFAEPSDIAIGPDGHIYVSDRTLGSVMRISGVDGTPLPAPGQTGAVFVAPGTGAIGVNPRIAFDPSGNLHVASDLGAVARVSRITGLLLGTAPTGLNDFTSADIAFDGAGRLYRSVGGTRIAVALQGEPVAFTDSSGRYVFGGLEPGTHTVMERVPADSIQTFDLSLAPAAPIDIFPGGSSLPLVFTLFNNTLYFSAFDATSGRELWRFDGRTATRVTDLAPGAVDSNPANLIVFDGALYFTATDGVFGNELWKYDGTAVTRITDIAPGLADALPTELTIFNDALYFAATEGFGAGQTGRELWRWDGTSVTRIADISPGTSSSSPSSLTVFNNALHFAAANATVGRELFRYDGSNVSVVANINPGSANSSPAQLMVLGGSLFFNATNAAAGTELWRFTGSSLILVDVNPGAASSFPSNLTAFNGLLHFTASDASGTELWRYNFVSPTRLTDINPGAGSSSPLSLTLFDGALYFSATDGGAAGTFGRELYRWDGAVATRITDINAGTLSSSPSNLIVFDDALYFAATDQNTVGNELWRWDGAVTLAADINPGFPFGSPAQPIVFDGSLFVRADRADVGTELWRYT
ncbi:MAG TPA: ELWxxDGT repeat protein, partial [Candidatus Limnocylindrales bacterium]